MDKNKSPFLEEEDVFALLTDYQPDDSNPSFDYGLLYLGSDSGSTNEASLGDGIVGENVLNSIDMQQNNSMTTKASTSQGLFPPVSFEANKILNSLDIAQEIFMATKSSESPGLFPPASLDASDHILNSLNMQQDNSTATPSSSKPLGLCPPVSLEAGNTMIGTVPSSQQAPRPGRRNAKDSEFRKIMTSEELASLTMSQPKQARRILTNRSAAVRAKARKKMEIKILEQQRQELHSTLTERNIVISKKEEDNHSLAAENVLLKEQVDMALQQISLQNSLIEEVISDMDKTKLNLGPIVPKVGAETSPLLNNNAPPPMLGAHQPQNVQFPNANNNAALPMPALQHPQLGPIVPNGGARTNPLLNNNEPLPMQTPQHPQNLQVPPQNQFGVGFQQPYYGPNNFGGQPSFHNPQAFLNQAQNEQGRGAVPLPIEPQEPLMLDGQLSFDHLDFSTDDFDFLLSLLGENGNDI